MEYDPQDDSFEGENKAIHGEVRCAVMFGNTSIPVVWHVISGSCEPILSGSDALQLGIIQFTANSDTFKPVLMIESGNKDC